MDIIKPYQRFIEEETKCCGHGESTVTDKAQSLVVV